MLTFFRLPRGMSIPHGNLVVATSYLLEIPPRRTHIAVAPRIPPIEVDDPVAGQWARREHSLRGDAAAAGPVEELEVDVATTRVPGGSAVTNSGTGEQGMPRSCVVP